MQLSPTMVYRALLEVLSRGAIKTENGSKMLAFLLSLKSSMASDLRNGGLDDRIDLVRPLGSSILGHVSHSRYGDGGVTISSEGLEPYGQATDVARAAFSSSA